MTKNTKTKQAFETRTIHVGGEPDPVTGAIMPPIFQTSTFVQKAPGTASGLSAAMLVMHLLPKGSKILVGDDVYGGTYRMFTTIFHERHEFKFIDTTDTKQTQKEIAEFKPALVWLESPTNPLLKLTDIKAVVAAAQKVKSQVLVDNTFMSPYFQNPMDLGADLVLHSMTKYINGHSDVVGGVLMYNDKKLNQEFFQSPFDSWLVLRGLKTLAVRMRAHEQGAMKIAKWLEAHKQVERVVYPGLKSHPQHALAKKQMSGFGGMITFFIKGGVKESKKFLKGLKLFALAESLGGVESLVEHPAIMTHASVPKKVRESIGLTDNLIRLSVGLEDIDDLINDLENGFKQK